MSCLWGDSLEKRGRCSSLWTLWAACCSSVPFHLSYSQKTSLNQLPHFLCSLLLKSISKCFLSSWSQRGVMADAIRNEYYLTGLSFLYSLVYCHSDESIKGDRGPISCSLWIPKWLAECLEYSSYTMNTIIYSWWILIANNKNNNSSQFLEDQIIVLTALHILKHLILRITLRNRN